MICFFIFVSQNSAACSIQRDGIILLGHDSDWRSHSLARWSMGWLANGDNLEVIVI